MLRISNNTHHRHPGRAERDPGPRGHERDVCPWVPGSRFTSPGMTKRGAFHDFSKFDAVIKFSIDQTYLPQIIGSLRDALSVSK